MTFTYNRTAPTLSSSLSGSSTVINPIVLAEMQKTLLESCTNIFSIANITNIALGKINTTTSSTMISNTTRVTSSQQANINESNLEYTIKPKPYV